MFDSTVHKLNLASNLHVDMPPILPSTGPPDSPDGGERGEPDIDEAVPTGEAKEEGSGGCECGGGTCAMPRG